MDGGAEWASWWSSTEVCDYTADYATMSGHLNTGSTYDGGFFVFSAQKWCTKKSNKNNVENVRCLKD